MMKSAQRSPSIIAGAFGQAAFVTLLDTTSPDPQNPINPVVVDNIGGASAGILFDGADRLTIMDVSFFYTF